MKVTTAAGTTRIHALGFDRNGKTSHTFEIDALEAELGDAERFAWIDIQGPDISILNDTLRRLNIDLVLVGHFDEPEVLPRIVERDDCLAFYLYEVEDPELHLDTSRGLRPIEFVRLVVAVGANFAVTYHRLEVDAVAVVRNQCTESFRLWGKTPGFVVFLLLQRCLYDYAHLNLANDNFLDGLSERAQGGDPDELAADISISGRNIVTLKKLISSQHIVLMLLSTKLSPFISPESRVFYHEMLQNAASVRGAIDSSRDLLDGILASIGAAAAQRTGDIARVLTVVSAVMLPLTLIAGIYGMNFEHMPELRMPWAYPAVLGSMVLLAIGLLFAFWRLGWLGGKPAKRKRSRGSAEREA